MFIKKVRIGFPTASSSTHSIVIHPQISKYNSSHSEEFGWDNFVAATRKHKHNYFAYIFRDNLASCIGLDAANFIVSNLFGVSERGFVDGNSVFSFPQKRFGRGIDMQFFNEFYAFLMREDVGIVGGNDNNTDVFEVPDARTFLNLEKFANLGKLICRKDPANYWILYNPKNGIKMRLSFTDEAIVYSLSPELIDLKITDYCPNQCSFCYQGSSRAGKHAQLDMNLAYEIAQTDAIEVVIGGGEPTYHPQLIEFVDYLQRYNVIVSLTTSNLNFLREENLAHFVRVGVTVRDRVGLFSVSRLSHDVKQKIALHVIDGVTSENFLRDVLDFCYNNFLPVVVLGFKKPRRPFPRVNTNTIQVLKEYIEKKRCPIVSVDTAFAQQYNLGELGINDILYDNTENFSMYVDLVAGIASKSSYDEDVFALERVTSENIISVYKSMKGLQDDW